MQVDDTPRCVVTARAAPTPQRLYDDRYGARGPGAHALKAGQHARHSARTSATPCLANARRLLRACAAAVLHQALRTPTLPPTALAHAPPSPVIRTLFKIAPQLTQDKDRLLLHLPSACPVTVL